MLSPTAPKNRSATKDAATPISDEMRYRAQDAMHTIARAEAHKRDPELMRHVKALADDVHRAVGGSMKGTEKGRPSAAKDPTREAKVSSGKRGLKAAQRPQAGKASKLAPMGGAKKKVR